MSPLVSMILVSFVLAAIETARVLPQAFRLWRRRDAAGVSGTSVGLRTVSGLGWVAYAFGQQQAGALFSCIAFQVAIVLTAWALTRAGGFSRRQWLPSLWWGLTMTAASVAGIPFDRAMSFLGLALIASIVISGVPQFVTAMTSPRLSGLSPVTLWLNVADALLWGAYGLITHDVTYILYFAIGLIFGLPQALRYHWVESGHGLQRARVALADRAAA